MRVDRGRPGKARAPLLAALVAALPALGCDRAEPPSPPPAPAPAAGVALALPAPGETRVERRGDRYDVASSDAAPLDALTELSMRAGFRVERGRGPLPALRRTVWLHDVPVERAVAAILAGVPHSVHHEFADGDLDPARPFEGRAVVLARVAVGDPGGVGGVPAERSGRSDRAARSGGEPVEGRARDTRPRKESALDAAPGAEARAAAEAERAAAVARDAEDPDADVRLEAVERMDPDAGDRAQLARMLRADGSPDVRAAAAEQLAEGDPFEATPILLNALADPDPTVVEAAVQALEDVYDEAPDPRIRESIAVLREHRDADVRAAVEEFEAWTEE